MGGPGLRDRLYDKPRTSRTSPTLCVRRVRDGRLHFGIFQHQVLAVWLEEAFGPNQDWYTLKGLLLTMGVLWAGLNLSPPPHPTPTAAAQASKPRSPEAPVPPQESPGVSQAWRCRRGLLGRTPENHPAHRRPFAGALHQVFKRGGSALVKMPEKLLEWWPVSP